MERRIGLIDSEELKQTVISLAKDKANNFGVTYEDYLKLLGYLGSYFANPPSSYIEAVKIVFKGGRENSDHETELLVKKTDTVSGIKRLKLTSDVLGWIYVASITDASKFGISSYALSSLEAKYLSKTNLPDETKRRTKNLISLTSEVSLLQRIYWKHVPLFNFPSFRLKPRS